MSTITLKTDHPVAFTSPDHIFPWGTMRDNSTNEFFIEEILEFCKINYNIDKIKFMDLGCSGGQLAVDFHKKGHIGVGLEGSDYSVKHQRANWPEYHNKILFTCDVTKPYSLHEEDGNQIKFNIITAWEVIEHILPEDLNNLFTYISNNLEDGGIFVGSISTKEEIFEQNGEKIVLHQTVMSKFEWLNELINNILTNTGLTLYEYPFQNVVRGDHGSFHILLQKSL
jgi:2-polyprenyl-3-methyl-5-hydroxy-6-metoxy-1,4-benzoquinol methylase